MKVLIACEFSGIVRDAFIERGHDAMSCDLLPTDREGPHYQGDVFDIIDQDWDLMIAHPPCTFLTCAAEWAYGNGPYHQKVKPGTLVGLDRRNARIDAINFVKKLFNQNHINKIAIENPIGILSSSWREPDQFIQPYEYLEDASKKTCLWLKNLPKLQPTGLYTPRLAMLKNGKGYAFRWSNQTDSGQNKETPNTNRSKIRSETYQGLAEALATQYTAFINSGKTVLEWENLLKGLDISRSNAIIDKYVQL